MIRLSARDNCYWRAGWTGTGAGLRKYQRVLRFRVAYRAYHQTSGAFAHRADQRGFIKTRVSSPISRWVDDAFVMAEQDIRPGLQNHQDMAFESRVRCSSIAASVVEFAGTGCTTIMHQPAPGHHQFFKYWRPG